MLFVAAHEAAFASAEAKVVKALSLPPDHARGHLILGMIYLQTRRAALGIAEMEHALFLDRNLPQARASVGLGKSYTGLAQEKEAHVREALRLSPRDSIAYIWLTFVGLAKTYLGLHIDAVLWFQRAIEANRNYSLPYFHLGGALARLGRSDEARSAAKPGSRSIPTSPSPACATNGDPPQTTNPSWPWLRTCTKACARPKFGRMIGGLRDVGAKPLDECWRQAEVVGGPSVGTSTSPARAPRS